MMTPIFRFEGIYTPLVTPYDSQGAVAWDVLADIIDHLIASGVHGLISGGSTGENYAQTVAERIEIARFSLKHIKNRVPLVVGTGAMLTNDSLALANAARDMKADALLLAGPIHRACLPPTITTTRSPQPSATEPDRLHGTPFATARSPF